MIQGKLTSVLLADSTILGLIGDDIYPVHAVQDPDFPFITHSTLSTNRQLTHSGSLNVCERTMQISCWGETPAQAYALANAVVKKMHGYKEPSGADRIHLATVVNEVELFDEDAKTYHIAIDVRITHNE